MFSTYFYLLALCIVVNRAAVIPKESEATIQNYENISDGAGYYKFSFETSNGIRRTEIGHLANKGQENEHMMVEGVYSYIDPDGKLVTVNYTADENGYHITPEKQPIPVKAIPSSVVASLLGK